MNSNLANQLLSNILEWDAHKLVQERSSLEFMGSMKYDGYDRYMPGTRFMSSLVQWLNQFLPEDREIVYNFIKQELIFISSTQMNYLVDLLYDSQIRPLLLNRAANKVGLPIYKRSNTKVVKQFKIEKRSALIVGLSDGAHTDILRRSAGFNNEQVLSNYYPDKVKLEDMLKELGKDAVMRDIPTPKFKTLFLIDDFTASGKSFLRYEDSDREYHGKLAKVISQLCEPKEDNLSYLFDMSDLPIEVHVLFCIATEKAKQTIEYELNSFLEFKQWSNKISVKIHLVQLIDNNISDRIRDNKNLIRVISKKDYFIEDSVISKSFKVGKYKNAPYLGFDECALPVVLSHNTPNNSLPILWQYNQSFRGLFPRISRH